MRTILINHMLEPPQKVTGITRFLFGMICGLLAATDDRYVLATSWTKEALPTELNHPRLQIETRDFYQSNTINIVQQRRELPKIVRQHGAEIEFNSNPIGAFGTTWPRIMTVHDLYLNLMPKEYSRKTIAVGTALMHLSTRKADGIMVPSHSTRESLSRFYPHLTERTFVIHEAAATLSAKPQHSALQNTRYGLMVGNISPNKNVGPLVQALWSLRQRNVDVPMIHVGRDENNMIRNAENNLGMVGAVRTISGVSDSDLQSLYENASFFINTSLHEGFCLPVIEAQIHGAPVIASNRSALPEVAGDGAILVDPQSPAAIAAAIERLWNDPALAENMRASGFMNAKRFSWERSAIALREKMEVIMLAHQSGSMMTATSDTHFA
ncbi:MAG: glycosyltransferase family 4 protein, partial [Beijerinckiaceae bacterium]